MKAFGKLTVPIPRARPAHGIVMPPIGSSTDSLACLFVLPATPSTFFTVLYYVIATAR